MYVTVDDDSRLGSTASSTPDLDAGQSAALDGTADGDDGRVAGVSSLQITEELDVISIRMVCCEP
jgi:hypothetical protein